MECFDETFLKFIIFLLLASRNTILQHTVLQFAIWPWRLWAWWGGVPPQVRISNNAHTRSSCITVCWLAIIFCYLKIDANNLVFVFFSSNELLPKLQRYNEHYESDKKRALQLASKEV